MDLSSALIAYGPLGIYAVASTIAIIRLNSKTERLEKEKSDLQEARRLDAIETRNQVTTVLSGISQNLENISDKMEIAQLQGRRRK